MLRTLPGVGEFTALVMVAEIGDITRFPNARKLASWAGRTPTVRGSDLKVRHGHISKQGLSLRAPCKGSVLFVAMEQGLLTVTMTITRFGLSI